MKKKYLLSEATYCCCTVKMIKIRRNVKNGIDVDLTVVAASAAAKRDVGRFE